MDSLTGAGVIGPQYGFEFYIFRGLALGAAVFPGLYSLARAESREKARQRRERIDDLKRVLEASVRRLFPGEDWFHIRANVMVATDDVLKVLCGWNMDAYPDNRMSLAYGVGVAGKVWVQAKEKPLHECWQPVYTPPDQLRKRNLQDQWGLSAPDISKTKHIRWILSTPLLYREDETLQFLGVFNLDGVIADLKSMDVFEDRRFHVNCVAAADLVATRIMEGDLWARSG